MLNIDKFIPDDVITILDRLSDNNFSSYIVGGCVRDLLLGKTPNDWDITTNAKPHECIEIFSKEYTVIPTGLKHGTVTIVINKNRYEVTTFRTDGVYNDFRRPENVEFTSDIVDDLKRRDFTINAMAYNKKDGLIDKFCGMEDLKNKTIKCVGKPLERFNEDALRILRGLRFSSKLGFEIENKTLKAMHEKSNLLQNISSERIATEFIKIICGQFCYNTLDLYKEILATIIPEIKVMFDYDQNTKYHNLDLWRHTITAVSNIKNDEVLRTTMFFHDIGKPVSMKTDEFGVSHYLGHAKASVEISRNILNRLKFSNKFTHDVLTLIEYHDVYFGESKKSVKKNLVKVGMEKMRQLIEIQLADDSAKSKYIHDKNIKRINNAIFILDEIEKNEECFTLKDLHINGKDIISIGVCEGKNIKLILDKLFNDVVNEKIVNDTNTLIKQAIIYRNDLI